MNSKKMISKIPNFEPRDYQLYYLEKAKKQNVIICLGTGSGKTFITIMLLQEYGLQIRLHRKKGIFLSPTNPLVIQQANEITKHTNFKTKVFYGDLGVDTWDKVRWMNEIENNEVLVLTPDILNTLLNKKLLELDWICVLIFDEAHWGGLKRKNKGIAQTKHAYKQIMNFIIKEKYHNKIRIIGTTASVINASFDPIHLFECFTEMERTFNARLLGEFEFDVSFLADPHIIVWLFEKQEKSKHDLLDDQVVNELAMISRGLKKKDAIFYNQLNMQSYLTEKQLIKPSFVVRAVRDLNELHSELGIWASLYVCRQFKKQLIKERNKISLDLDENSVNLIDMLNEYLDMMDSIYSKFIEKLQNLSNDNILLNLASAKLLRLLDILHCYIEQNSNYSILIFVDRVLFSFAISSFITEIAKTERFSNFKPQFYVGHNNEYLNFSFIKKAVKESQNIIKDFNNGNLNILISTAVLEEGIDIRNCNLVIRFDEPKTYREFMQSKGRARAENSFFVILHNDLDKISQKINLHNETEKFLIHRFEQSKTEKFNNAVLSDDHCIDEAIDCLSSRTGAQILIHEAPSFLHRYLCKRGNKNQEPSFEFNEGSTGFRCSLNLIAVTPIDRLIEGKVHQSREDAFNSACLAACKELYEIGQLDDNLIPITDEAIVKRFNPINNDFDEEEIRQLKYTYSQEKQRMMFKRCMGDIEYFKKFTNNKGLYDLYEISFETADDYLNDKREKLALLTEIQLTSSCKLTSVYSSTNVATIKLTLINRVQLDDHELKQVGEFTKTIIKTAIPIFKKRDDLKFDLSKCLFKFVFLDNQSFAIDYERMKSIVNFSADQNLQSIRNVLVRATHTNTDYLLLSTQSSKYPHDKFQWNGQNITFNEFFKRNYNIEIKDQSSQLYELQKSELNQLYSIFMDADDVTENKSSNFRILIPKELLVISPYSKALYKKLNCLPPLIYRVKQKIILKHFSSSLDHEILDVAHDKESFESILNVSAARKSMDEFMEKDFEQNSSAFFESSNDDANSQMKEDEELEEMVMKAEQETREKLIRYKKNIERKQLTEFDTVHQTEHIVYPTMKQAVFDTFLASATHDSLSEKNFSSFDEFAQKFVHSFQAIAENTNERIKKKNFEDVPPEIKRRKLDSALDWCKFDFNQWTNQQSDRSLFDPFILLEALSAKSAQDGVNLERLEFLGDSLLKLITCSLLFHLEINLPVGEMDIVKTSIISNKNLFGISLHNNLYKFLFAHKFLPGVNFLPFGFEYEGKAPDCSNRPVIVIDEQSIRKCPMDCVDRSKFQQLKAKSVSDGIESLIGAVLVSTGMRNACLLMKHIGIYPKKFEITKCTQQQDLFPTYNPLKNERHQKFVDEMYYRQDFRSLEYWIDYEFKNKALLIQAFKHVSYDEKSNFPSYERLEFLGDAVIDYLIARFFYEDEANFSPGQLSEFKVALLNNQFFAELVVKNCMENYMIHNSPALFYQIEEFREYFQTKTKTKAANAHIMPNSYAIIDLICDIDHESNIEANKSLGDIFESMIGAIFIDAQYNLNVVWSVLVKFMINELIAFKNSPPKSLLAIMHEIYPDAKFSNTRMKSTKTLIDIKINERTYTGIGENKKLAKINAAKQVIRDSKMRN